MSELKHFELLNAINVNDKTKTKEINKDTKLTYLSWVVAWEYVKKNFPDASYNVWRNADGLPYAYDENTGYMVYTSVTIEGITHEMWLPVMDGKNKAMKSKAYTYQTRWGDNTVEPANMFDINKTIMRCLTKNLAMFGLGLYIYEGEDLPSKGEAFTQEEINAIAQEKIEFLKYIKDKKYTQEELDKICKYYGAESIEFLTPDNIKSYMEYAKLMSEEKKKGGK